MDENTTSSTEPMSYSGTFMLYSTVTNYFILALCIAGIACNSICLFVFSRYQFTRDTTRFLLQMLAVADLIFLLVHIANRVLGGTTVTHHTINLVKMVTIWLVAVIAIDRYLVICRPQLAARYSTLPRVKLAVCAVWIVTILLTVPLYFLEHLKLPPLGLDVYLIGYRMCFIILVGYVLPLSVITSLTVRLNKSHLQSERSDPVKMSDSADEVTAVGDQYTDTLLNSALNAVIIVFTAIHIICAVLMLYQYITWYNQPYDISLRRPKIYDAVLYSILHMLLVTIASFKLSFYSLSNSNFHQIMRGCCRCTRQPRTPVDDEVPPYNVSYQGNAVMVSNNPGATVKQ